MHVMLLSTLTVIAHLFLIAESSTWLDSYRFLWNESTLTYTLLIHWTVPSINGFRNIVKDFHIYVLHPSLRDNTLHSYQNFRVEAVVIEH